MTKEGNLVIYDSLTSAMVEIIMDLKDLEGIYELAVVNYRGNSRHNPLNPCRQVHHQLPAENHSCLGYSGRFGLYRL